MQKTLIFFLALFFLVYMGCSSNCTPVGSDGDYECSDNDEITDEDIETIDVFKGAELEVYYNEECDVRCYEAGDVVLDLYLDD